MSARVTCEIKTRKHKSGSEKEKSRIREAEDTPEKVAAKFKKGTDFFDVKIF